MFKHLNRNVNPLLIEYTLLKLKRSLKFIRGRMHKNRAAVVTPKKLIKQAKIKTECDTIQENPRTKVPFIFLNTENYISKLYGYLELIGCLLINRKY